MEYNLPGSEEKRPKFSTSEASCCLDDVDWSDWSHSDTDDDWQLLPKARSSRARKLESPDETDVVDLEPLEKVARRARSRQLDSTSETDLEVEETEAEEDLSDKQTDHEDFFLLNVSDHDLMQLAEVEEDFSDKRTDHEDFFLLNVSDDDLMQLAEASEPDDVCLSWMPVEVLELVFCQLPIGSLLHVGLACKRFYQVVANEKFMYWKKSYFKYHKVAAVKSEILGTSSVRAVLASGGTIMDLAREMGCFRGGCCYSGINKALRSSVAFPIAVEILMKRLHSSCSVEELNTFSLLTLLVVISNSVEDVEHVIKCLLHRAALGSSRLDCSVQYAVDCLYCVATHLLVLEELKDLPPRLYYHLMTALWRYENIQSKCSESMHPLMHHSILEPSIQLTAEQLRIVNHNMNEDDLVRVVAYAGTGKTSTLVRYTQAHSDVKFLAVSYNKSVQMNARKLFPSNVDCFTIHALAWKAVGYRYGGKIGNVKPYDALKSLPQLFDTVYAKLVLETLQNFLSSADMQMGLGHVPTRLASRGEELIRDAAMLWSKMVDIGDMSLKMVHDGYLKLFQLDRPILAGYQCILVDEAQDCSPAITDILLLQKCAKVFVGDPNQQIYRFRGAINVLQTVKATHTYSLTKSFRFGPEIASVAMCLLSEMKGAKTIIHGCSQPGDILGNAVGQVAVIARTNAELFNKAVDVCLESSQARVAFIGGIDSYGFDQVLDIYRLFSGDRKSIKNRAIAYYHSFAQLKAHTRDAQDPEMMGKIKIVEHHHCQIPSRIELLRSRSYSDPDLAQIVFTTAHKAKGLEFDTVRLLDDFLVSRTEVVNEWRDVAMGSPRTQTVADDDEVNLLYVAATRAKKCLLMSRTLVNVLRKAGERFLQVYSLAAVDKDMSFTCQSCKQQAAYSRKAVIGIEQQRIVLASGRVYQTQGPLCSNCSIKFAPCWKGLC